MSFSRFNHIYEAVKKIEADQSTIRRHSGKHGILSSHPEFLSGYHKGNSPPYKHRHQEGSTAALAFNAGCAARLEDDHAKNIGAMKEEAPPYKDWARDLGKAKQAQSGNARDPETLYKSSDYDMSKPQNYHADLTKRSAGLEQAELQEILLVCSNVCQSIGASLQLSRSFEGGFVFVVTLSHDRDSYPGQTNITSLTSALAKALLRFPQCVCDLLDETGRYQEGPGAVRSKAWYRIRNRPWSGGSHPETGIVR